jgi:Putative transposase
LEDRRIGSASRTSAPINCIAQKRSWSHINQTACPLRFFDGVTLGRQEAFERIVTCRKPEELPPVLSPEEIAHLLEAVAGLRNRVALTTAGLSDPSAFAEYLGPLSKTPWIVFAKRPFAGPSQILDYLGRYSHRVAIANGRLLDCRDGRVSFRWKDYRAQNKSKAMTLDADESTRRFLLHVLPKGFRRIRHFGFLANACRVEKLARIRAAFPTPERHAELEDYRERCAQLTGNRIDICPFCGGRMVDIGSWPHHSPPRPTRGCDTS